MSSGHLIQYTNTPNSGQSSKILYPAAQNLIWKDRCHLSMSQSGRDMVTAPVPACRIELELLDALDYSDISPNTGFLTSM